MLLLGKPMSIRRPLGSIISSILARTAFGWRKPQIQSLWLLPRSIV
ncbi:hypothetical protein Golob_013249 [Gossypium lobatum]|uniref:Uncharacterized protein n=1 Tax=Gossypium lobatum TaxID=34289 RepID=A0A7J8LNV6_9ROSI|nr:hypothetical protein [Gossypium lobatum]